MPLYVLLVDDEYLVLKGLEILLSEQHEVPLVIHTAMDAVDALEKLDGFWPDVIIADINMPEIDGLTMLEKVNASHPCKYIIISGHEDHEYLKRALKLHVAEYLSKPVDKVCLIHRLKEIYKEKKEHGEHVKLKLQMLLYSGKKPEFPFSRRELEQLLPSPYLALFTAGLTAEASELLQEQLSGYFDAIHRFCQDGRVILLLNYSAKIQKKEIRAILKQFLSDTVFGLSVFDTSLELPAIADRLYLTYQEALGDSILSQLTIPEEMRLEAGRKISSRTLLPAVSVIRFDLSIADYMEEVYDPETEMSVNYLQVFVEALAAYFLAAGIHLPCATILQLYQSGLSSMEDKKTLCAFLEKMLNFWYDSFTPVEQVAYSSKITAARQYIDKNYTLDLALEQVAEAVSINPSYLSYIFRKETGNTFLQYLTNLRLQAACQLLLSQPELSLEEVATKVGYHSASYFHKIFRSRFQVSPRQWMQNETGLHIELNN